ncbi:MAG: NADH-quinone oxidoreductase subunit NuoG [Armatimonadota bacterium]
MSDNANQTRDRTAGEKADAAKVEADHAAAKAAGAEMITLVVDGKEVEVPKGTLVIEAAFRAGSDIPYFCYHPRLTSVGACRMCLASVELEMFGQRRASIMATCTVPCGNGMVVRTNTPDVKKAQAGILEFLLANHPLDCPICDRGGECPLQNMTIAYGPPTSRFVEEKRHFPKSRPISDHVVLDRERCIQCMRCTRFADEIAGDSKIGLLNRGAAAEVGPFLGANFDSNFSGNTIEICPVGALTSRQYRFKGRPWEVKSADSVCSRCGNGCNIALQHRMGEVVRVNARTNEDVNEEWTCDRGKFGHFHVNSSDRLTQPLVRDPEGRLVPTDWNTALARVAEELRHHAASGAVAGIASNRCTLEENYLFAKLLKGTLGAKSVDHRYHAYPVRSTDFRFARLEAEAHVVTCGFRCELDQPMVHLRLRKGIRRRTTIHVAAESVEAAIAALRPETLLLVSEDLTQSDFDAIERACSSVGARWEILVSRSGSRGASEAGCLPDRGVAGADPGLQSTWPGWSMAQADSGLDMHGILGACVSGAVRCLYVMGSDPAERFPDADLASNALKRVPFLIVQDLFLTETARQAHVVLPAASFAEKEGTFVNVEGRHQTFAQAIPPRGGVLPDWRILADLLARCGNLAPYFSPKDIAREWSTIAGGVR